MRLAPLCVPNVQLDLQLLRTEPFVVSGHLETTFSKRCSVLNTLLKLFTIYYVSDTCAPGFENVTGVCVQCRAGYVKDTPGLHPCVPCSAGTSPNDNHTQCIVCPPETFAQNEGQPSCDICYGEVIFNGTGCSKLYLYSTCFYFHNRYSHKLLNV